MTVSTIGGRYSRDSEIGRGGMGAVWRGTDQVLGRSVAVKRIGIAPGGATPDALRAEREARLAASLNDPHVVSVFDLVDDGGEQWLVMEYVEGTDLAELIRQRGALDPDEIAPILAQAAGALAAAHASGIVHRDVKPSNMLVTPAGDVKLSDFGIARTQADAALTQTGLVTGSPAYLSPEVASGRVATSASDVWSLGATVYHALEGHPPYDLGENVIGGLYRIVHEEPPRPAQPGWLAPLLPGTMTHEPTERWTAHEVQEFLQSRGQVVPVAAVATQLMAPTPITPVEPAQPLEPAAFLEPAMAAPAGHRGGSARRARPAWALFAAALAVLAVVAVGGWAITFGFGGDSGSDSGGGSARAGAPSSTQPSGSPSSGAPSDSASPGSGDVATADGMTAFLSGYLQTVTSDRTAAFDMLTAGYQQRSGGREGYRSFWGKVTQTQLLSANADPDALTISYTYRYVRDGRRSDPETHQMTLKYADGQYLIDAQT